MPKSSKKRKDKKKKGLSTEDILKIIKKLKPKTQQIVKVNVGDHADKKKSPAINPQFFERPTVTIGTPAIQPPLMEPPKTAPSWSNQPAKTPALLMPPPLPQPPSKQISFKPDISESEVSDIEITSNKGKGYTERTRRTPRVTRQNPAAIFEEMVPPEPKFTNPKKFSTSILASAAAAPTHFSFAVENDKYQPDIINIGQQEDQIGNTSNSLPSDLWTGSPEGEITLSPEEIAAAEKPLSEQKATAEEIAAFAAESEGISSEKVASEVAPAEEEIMISVKPKKEKLKAPETLSEIIPKKTPESETSYTKTVKASLQTIAEVNAAIEKGFKSKNIPESIIYKTGTTKGFIKKSAPSYLLAPIYEEVKTFNKSK